ncbi:hypothetical protein ACKWTF_014491 [Chironomus riparius]
MKIAFVLCILAISVNSAPQLPNFQFPQFNFPSFGNLNFPNFNTQPNNFNMFPNMMPQSTSNFNPSENSNNFEPSKNPDNFRPSETPEESNSCMKDCEPKPLNVCAYDTDPKFGMTFQSECEMDKFACEKRSGQKFKGKLLGDCPN